MSDLTLIDTSADLEALIAEFSSAPWLAMDTEFYRERTYKPQLCLIQFATPDRVAMVDPRALESLEPLLDLLYNADLTKVLHSARQDLELFYWMRGNVPVNLFDTQLAAPHLGYAKQIGYANLVREMLEVDLPKAYTRTDWKKRPLSQDQLQYAADDVIYLAQLYPIMRGRLEKEEKLAGLERECGALSCPEVYEPPAEEMWKKIKGSAKLKAGPRGILQALAAWREVTARESDIPRGWLLKDGVLMALARQAPAKMDDLHRIKGLAPRTMKRRGKVLLRIIAESSGQG